MSLAGSLFSHGKISPSLFDDLTKEFLFLPQSQNEALTKFIQLERMFLKFKRDKNFAPTFQYVEQMDKVAKHLRFSERTVALAMSGLTRCMKTVGLGVKDLGFLFPVQGPFPQFLGPRKAQDQLTYSQLPVLPLPLPSLDSLQKVTSVYSQDTLVVWAVGELC